jgi:uncharacterized protein (TIGR02145 family)
MNDQGILSSYIGNGYAMPSTRRGKSTDQPVIESDQWTFITCTFKSTEDIEIFINGKIVPSTFSGSATSIKHTNTSGAIGNQYININNFHGYIDDVEIYNMVLSEAEISALYLKDDWIDEPEVGTFTDSRDGNKYKWVKIGNQTWMAENLKFLPIVNPGSTGSYTDPNYYVLGYQGKDVDAAMGTQNYQIYGVLYNHQAAKIACPSGWHLPTDEEWNELEIFAGLNPSEEGNIGFRGTTEGRKLKSSSGWLNNGNGSDQYGFKGLPAGSRSYWGEFGDSEEYGSWWTSSLKGTKHAWNHFIYAESDQVGRTYGDNKNGLSVRCLKSD